MDLMFWLSNGPDFSLFRCFTFWEMFSHLPSLLMPLKISAIIYFKKIFKSFNTSF